MFCRFFILRPVLSIVISIVIVLAGLISLYSSDVAQYPDIVPPNLNISVRFPGADAETIANSVAAPLEDQMPGVPGLIYMQSTSNNGNSSLSLNLYFDVGTDLKTVEADVLNRVNTALPQLPTQVQAQGVTMRLKNPDLFQAIPFYSDNGNPSPFFISNYMQRYIYPVLLQLKGVGSINIQGQRRFSMRVRVDPNKLNYYGIGIDDIKTAINDQNYPWAIGEVAMEPINNPPRNKYNFVITSPGYMTSESQFKNIVLRVNQNNTQVIRLKNVADVLLDAEQYNTYLETYRHEPVSNKIIHRTTAAMLIYLTPSANQLETRKLIRNTLDTLSHHFPPGLKYYIHYDSSTFVILAIKSVVTTLIIAFILVFLVVLLFIQKIKSTLIPIIAIPVAIIGTFAGTYILGFSINTLTLFGMVLAIGIVVDDAIVVIENVERLMVEEKLSPLDAALKCMEEVAAPVIAIVAVLNAVFLPIIFLSGFTGVLLQQFAVTVAISTLLSGIVALTLTPTLCAMMLQPHQTRTTQNKFIVFILLDKWCQYFNLGFAKLLRGYLSIVTFMIDHLKMSIAIFVLATICAISMFIYIPSGLIPLEDLGYFYMVERVNAAGAEDYNLAQAKSLSQIVMNNPAVNRVAALVDLDLADNGAFKTNTSSFSVILKDYADRPKHNSSINDILHSVNTILKNNKQIAGFAFNTPPIRGLSPTGGVTFYLQSNSPLSIKEIYADSIKLIAYFKQHDSQVVQSANQYYDINTPELHVEVDPAKLYLYGLTYGQLFNTLQSIFGVYYVNYFTKWEDLWWVTLQSDYKFRSTPELLNTIYIKNNKGAMIPAGSVIKLSYENHAEVVTRLNDFLASQITVNPTNNHSSGDVMNVIRKTVPKLFGSRYTISWFGPSYQENLAGNTSMIALSLGLLMVFLILAALYEVWHLPIVILMALPFAICGAGAALIITHMQNDLYFKVSMLTLIGLSAKNAILLVEFAIQAVRQDKLSYREAALFAAKTRFRPIVMTSIAFICGALPLVFATGAGSNAQHSVGIGIVGGMLGSTCISIIFVPAFFVLLMQIFKSSEERQEKLIALRNKVE